MENKGLIHIEQDECTLCYSCIRTCPVKAILVQHNKSYAEIDIDRCIGCGYCLTSCPEDAISYQTQSEEVLSVLKSDTEVVAVVDPAISGEFDDITDYRKFVSMIRQLGFSKVTEVSFGVDLVAQQYNKLVNDNKGKYYIFSSCPAVVSHIEKYAPELIPNLAPLNTPMTTTAHVARQTYGEEIKVVAITPCIEARKDIERYKEEKGVDYLLTFTDLRNLFKSQNIEESQLEFSEFDNPLGYKGGTFALSNGIIQTAGLEENLLETKVISVEGKENMLLAIDEFKTNIDSINKHFNLFYCEGCIMGPGTTFPKQKFLRRALVTDYVEKRLKDFDLKRWEKDVKQFSTLDFSANFNSDDQRRPEPPEERIQEIVKMIGGEHKNEKGCTACGYDSCREFASAVAKGLAKTEMCHSYTLKNQNEYISSLKESNEKLAATRAALEASEKQARKEQQAATDAMETTRAMLQKLPSGVVLVNEDLKVVLSNDSFIDMLGDDVSEINEIIPGLIGADLKTLLPYNFYKLFQYVLDNDESVVNRDVNHNEGFYNVSVFTIRKEKIVGAVIRDMQLPEVQQEEVMLRLDEAIKENLMMVQQIGFLLGEGASKTERALNSIIESYTRAKKSKDGK